MRTGTYRELQYQYEVMRARLDIRDHYVKSIVRDVYDNIGQMLSLARVEIAKATIQEGSAGENPNAAGEYVGMAIRDLRQWCSRFESEMNIGHWEGWVKAAKEELSDSRPAAEWEITNEPPKQPGENMLLISFALLLKFLSFTGKIEGNNVISKVRVGFSNDRMVLEFFAGDGFTDGSLEGEIMLLVRPLQSIGIKCKWGTGIMHGKTFSINLPNH